MSSPTFGTKPIAIAGRTVRVRERVIGMTNEERKWRAQYLKDMELHHGPSLDKIKALHASTTNPIKRFYTFPLNAVCSMLEPMLGHAKAYRVRFFTGKALIAATAIYSAAYYFKYNANDWTRKGGWRILKARKAVVPGDSCYPRTIGDCKSSDYGSRGFDSSVIGKMLDKQK